MYSNYLASAEEADGETTVWNLGFEENNYYNRVATCVLQNCEVNYTPTGVKSFEDGGPTQTTMSLTFKETELLTKDLIAEGY